MEYLEDWVDKALSCFYKERDKDSSETKIRSPLYYLDPIELLDEGQLKNDFEKFVADLGLTEDKMQELFDYPREKKIALLNSQLGLETADCEDLIEILKSLESDFKVDHQTLTKLQNVVITLRTQGENFVSSFLSSSGLSLLSSTLSLCHSRPGREPAALLLIYAFRALLNSPVGRTAVLQSRESLLSIASSCDFSDSKCKIVSIEILSGLCFVPEEGHQQVLSAISEVSVLLGERTRFQRLVEDLHRNFSSDRETDRVRTAIFGLINALLSSGPAESSVHFRAHLRFELLMLGVARAAEAARPEASSRLEDHIDLFQMMRKEDDLTLSGSSCEDSGASSPVDYESVVGMAEALHEKLNSSMALPHFVSLLQHLFIVPCDEKHVPLWRLFDLILQQLTLQTTVQGITDVHRPITGAVDMNEVLSRLHTQCDFERVESEKEKLQEELDAERMRNVELENRLADAQDGRASISSRISSVSLSPSDPCPSPPLLPPVCPPSAPPPPPPPGGMKMEKISEVMKKVPTPPGPLKSLNWNKMTADKVKGTVWELIEDEKMYKQLDMAEIAETFAASSSHKDDDTETVAGSIGRRAKDTQITVIDARRYQNCGIMLSKLKLTHKEIKSALLGMDEKGKLPKDMIEQMLKFVPTKEEVTQINEIVNRYKTPTVLALADRYLYEVAQIPRFEQRLRCLHIIRTFKDRIDYLIPLIQAVTKASGALSSNKRFKQLLALVLAVGNYLNHGKRNGNAYGFDLNSLNRLSDVKCSQRADRNLLHYLTQWIERRNPDLTKMKRELAGIYEAARFNRGEAVGELRSLEQAITAVRAELSFVESAKKEQLPEDIREDNKKDQFASVAKQFIASATADYNSLDKLFGEMKMKYGECARLFCFDPQSSPEEMFSVMAKFLNAFSEYHHQLWLENEEQEKVKKQTIARSYFAKKTRRREAKERDFEQLISALQSGDIFKDELSRLRTSFRVTKRTRTAKA